MKPLIHLNLKIKLILFLSIMLLVVCGTLSFIFAYHTIDVFEDDLKKRGISEAINLAIESKFGTLAEDAEILNPLLEHKLVNQDILYLKVINKDKEILASVFRYRPSDDHVSMTNHAGISDKPYTISTVSSLFYIKDTLSNVNYFKIVVPIFSTPLLQSSSPSGFDEFTELEIPFDTSGASVSKKNLGEVHIGISLTWLEQKTSDVLTFISLVTLVVLLLAILIGYVLARRAIIPLLTMSDIATQIANTNLQNVSFSKKSMTLNGSTNTPKYTLVQRSSDEIGLLTTAFIKMSSRLKDYGYNLELQVKERTEELFQALQQSRKLKSVAESTNKQLLIANHQLQLFQLCIEKTSDFILITDQNGCAHTCNQSFQQHSEYTSDQVEQLSLNTFFAPSEIEIFNLCIWPIVKKKGEWKGKTRFKKSSGSVYAIDLSISSVSDENHDVIAYICIFRDITLEEQHKLELVELASRDSLTGLYNRRRFLEELEKEIIRSKRQQSEMALLWLDLDHFKEINDSLGHPAGDELLKVLAHNLKGLTRETDLVARLGGDEFAILLSDTPKEAAKINVERLINGFRSNLNTIDSQPVRMMISMGIAMFPRVATSSDDLFACADIALYKSKHAGRNQFNFFHPDDLKHQHYSHHDAWNQRIWNALDEHRLSLYRQAIVNINSGEITHYELLLRMHDEQGNTILPGAFIPLAERTGMIHEIDRWVIKNAVEQYADSALQQKNIKVSINLSAKALSDESFPGFIESEFNNASVDPKMFILEITENSAIADFKKATYFINRLKQVGCEFALDDFGVGFASFSHLRNLDVSYLKIDGSFIKEINLHSKDKGIVEAMIKVAQSLNVKTIAECVETAETLALLKHLGTDYVQGYFFGKPEPLSNNLKR